MGRQRRTIPRRTFLKGSFYGAGVALGLPFLESIMGRLPGALAAPSPKRFISMFVPNGIVMNQWDPAIEGTGYALTPILQPLSALKSNFTVISGLSNIACVERGLRVDAVHGKALAGVASGSYYRHTTDADLATTAESLDQLLVRRLQPTTPIKSLTLATENDAGDTDDWADIYSQTLSWRGQGQGASNYIDPIKDPVLLFNRIFGSGTGGGSSGGGSGEPSAAVRALARRRKSMLDLVWDDAKSIQGKLGRFDQSVMEQYLESIREIEKSLTALPTSTPTTGVCTPPPRPGDNQGTNGGDRKIALNTHLQLYFDMLTVAFQCDLTRIATMTFASEGSSRTYNEIDVPYAHHPLSHYNAAPVPQAQAIPLLVKINTFHVQQLAYFLDKLSRTSDSEQGNLLGQTIAVYGCAIADSVAHHTGRIPILVAGGGGGTIRHQGHVRLRPIQDTGGYDKHQDSFDIRNYNPICNLYVRILRAMGLTDVTRFGDSNDVGPGLNDKLAALIT